MSPRPRREEVRHVEAAGAAHQRGHALLEEHPLQQLGLGLVARPTTLTSEPSGYSGRILRARSRARGVGAVRDRVVVDQRDAAAPAEPLRVRRAPSRRRGRRAPPRIRPTSSSASETSPSTIRPRAHVRLVGLRRPTMTYSASG